MAVRVAIVGGTGLYELPSSEPIEIETDHGDVVLQRTRIGARETFFLPRHGPDHKWTPLRINHRANVAALAAARCDYVIAVNNVGSLRPEIRAGSWVVFDDFLDAHHANRPTFHEDAAVHTDFGEPYCPTIRKALRSARKEPLRGAVYAGTDGPRFETRAEAADLARGGGDVVGMTGVPEAVLAHEKGLCYAGLGFVGNLATGLSRRRIRATDVQRGLHSERKTLLSILEAAVRRLPTKKPCDCSEGTRFAALTWRRGAR